MGFAGPVRQQACQGRVTNSPPAGFRRKVVIKVVQDDQDRHLAEDVLAEQRQSLGPRQVDTVSRLHRLRRDTAPGRNHRVMAKGRGEPGEKPVGRHFAADDRGHALGFEAADPRGDLGGQGGLADAADAVQHQPGHCGARQVRRPAPPLDGPDRQGRGPARLTLSRSGVPGGVRHASRFLAPRFLRLGRCAYYRRRIRR